MDNQWCSSWARFSRNFPNKIIRIIWRGQFTILSLLKIGMKKMEYKTRKWHDKCFQCVVCKTQVGSKPFIIPNETDVYCVGCFEEKFATKCTKCKKIMTTGGVTFKNEVWVFVKTSWILLDETGANWFIFDHGLCQTRWNTGLLFGLF